MESGGVLALSTSSADGLVKVTVADSGAGIVRENLERIFDPFFTTKMAKKGTGLGLSVSYGIVREHGGDIEVTSEPGAGTRFALSFPEARPGRGDQPIKSDRPLRDDTPVKRPELVPAEPVPAAAMSASAMSSKSSATVASTQTASPSQSSAPAAAVGMIANSDRMIQ
jgi:hypothetical protein